MHLQSRASCAAQSALMAQSWSNILSDSKSGPFLMLNICKKCDQGCKPHLESHKR